MQIHALTSLRLIKPKMAALCKEEAIRELALLLDKAGKLKSLAAFLKDVFRREKEYPTGIGRGIAIPHARSAAVKESCLAVGKCRRLDWSGTGEELVELVMLLAVPKTVEKEHLLILKELAELLVEEKFTERLLKACTREEIYRLFKEGYPDGGEVR